MMQGRHDNAALLRQPEDARLRPRRRRGTTGVVDERITMNGRRRPLAGELCERPRSVANDDRTESTPRVLVIAFICPTLAGYT